MKTEAREIKDALLKRIDRYMLQAEDKRKLDEKRKKLLNEFKKNVEGALKNFKEETSTITKDNEAVQALHAKLSETINNVFSKPSTLVETKVDLIKQCSDVIANYKPQFESTTWQKIADIGLRFLNALKAIPVALGLAKRSTLFSETHKNASQKIDSVIETFKAKAGMESELDVSPSNQG